MSYNIENVKVNSLDPYCRFLRLFDRFVPEGSGPRLETVTRVSPNPSFSSEYYWFECPQTSDMEVFPKDFQDKHCLHGTSTPFLTSTIRQIHPFLTFERFPCLTRSDPHITNKSTMGLWCLPRNRKRKTYMLTSTIGSYQTPSPHRWSSWRSVEVGLPLVTILFLPVNPSYSDNPVTNEETDNHGLFIRMKGKNFIGVQSSRGKLTKNTHLNFLDFKEDRN